MPTSRDLTLAAIAGLAISAACVTLKLMAVGDGAIDFTPFVQMYDDASTPAERWLVAGDGQAHALIAVDPTLDSLDLYGSRAPQYAYRSQRPLMGIATWAVAGGNADRVPGALVLVFTLSGVVMAIALREHVPLRWVVVGTAVALTLSSQSPVAEPLGIALLLLGLHAWRLDRRWQAIGWFALAGLTRETMLLVPLAIALHCATQRRPVRVAQLLASFTPLLAWIAFVRLRIGAWPWEAGNGRLGAPLGGLTDAISAWGATEAAVCIALVVSLGVLWVHAGEWRSIGLVFTLLASVLGNDVWASALDFGRVLLPVPILGLALAARPGGSMPYQADLHAGQPMIPS